MTARAVAAVAGGAALAFCGACGARPPAQAPAPAPAPAGPTGTIAGQVMVQGTASSPPPATGVVVLTGDGHRVDAVVGRLNTFVVHVPVGTYRVGGDVATMFASHQHCTEEDGSVVRVTAGRTTQVTVGCGLP